MAGVRCVHTTWTTGAEELEEACADEDGAGMEVDDVTPVLLDAIAEVPPWLDANADVAKDVPDDVAALVPPAWDVAVPLEERDEDDVADDEELGFARLVAPDEGAPDAPEDAPLTCEGMHAPSTQASPDAHWEALLQDALHSPSRRTWLPGHVSWGQPALAATHSNAVHTAWVLCIVAA